MPRAAPADFVQASPGALFPVEELTRLRAEVLDALQRGAKLSLPAPVPVLLLTRADASERRRQFAEDLESNRGLTRGMDLMADFLFSDVMLGRYLPDEGTFYVIDEVLRSHSRGRRSAEDLLFAVMAHELVHAYDHQVHAAVPTPDSLLESMADLSRLPELQALMGLLEGRATFLAELACAAAGRPLLEAPSEERARKATVMSAEDGMQGAVAGALNVVARTKLIQYAWGREFCSRAHAFGGEAFMNQVFASLPLSLAELRDFDTFKLRWAADMESRMEREDAEAEAAAAAAGSAADSGEAEETPDTPD